MGLTINEDTGETPICAICGNLEYWECDHLVADLDLTFNECVGGALFDRERDFEITLKDAFLPYLKRGSVPHLNDPDLKALWDDAKHTFSPEDDEVEFGQHVLNQACIGRLENAGAQAEHFMEQGPPGLSSQITILFADDPEKVVDEMLSRFVMEVLNLRSEPSKSRVYKTAAKKPDVKTPLPKPIPSIDFGPPEPLTIVSEDASHVFLVEVARSEQQQRRGLMYRESLAHNAGMLLLFEKESVAYIWMKNTPIALDIIFVRSDGKISEIEHSAQPYLTRHTISREPVVAALEIVGGQAKVLGIRPGDVVHHSHFLTAQ